MESDIGLTPNNDGKLIRLAIPELNEERRSELVKVVRAHRRGGPDRDPQRPPRRHARPARAARTRARSAPTTSTAPRPSCRSSPTHDRRARRRSSRARKPRSSRSDGRGGGRAARYVAIITDGNGRWAAGTRPRRSLDGHQAGADTVKARLRDAVDLGIEELTVYSFSTENWSRPAEEVAGADGDVRPAHRRRDAGAATTRACGCASSGAATGVAPELLEQMELGRGADRRQRPDHALRRVQLRRPRGDPRRGGDATTGGGEDDVPRRCSTRPDMHDPDLVIRTSGEQRLSQLPAVAVARTPSSSSATSCGPTSTARRFEACAGRVRRAASGASGAADAGRAARRRDGARGARPRGATAAPSSARASSRRSRRSPSRCSSCSRGGWFFVGGAHRARDHLPARAVLDVLVTPPVAPGAGSSGCIGHARRRAARRRRHGAARASWPRSRSCSCSGVRPAASTRRAPGVSVTLLGPGVDRPGLRARRAAARPAARRRRSSSTCSSARSSATPAPTSAAGRWAARQLAPAISPNKTVEGLVDRDAGRRSPRVWFAGLYQDWLSG